ncbi:MAG: hypothetical protein RJA22_2852 [Verrucomicrobiota bacterium]
MKTLVRLLALLGLLTFAPATHAATFGWSGSGSGGGSGANTAWLTAGNWTNNSGFPTNIDFALFGAAGPATSIGFNFNAPAQNTTNMGLIAQISGRTNDVGIGNSSGTAGIQTRLYHFGVGGMLLSNITGRTLTFQPFAGGSGNGMTNVIMAAGTVQANGNIRFLSSLTDAGTARNITKTGVGQLILGTNNNYLGNFIVSAGGLVIKNSGSLGSNVKAVAVKNGSAGKSHLILDNTGNGADIIVPANISFETSWVDGTITNAAGNNAILGNILLTGGGGDTTIRANSGSLTLRGIIQADQVRGLQLGGSSTSTNTIAGPIVGGVGTNISLTKVDAGTWTLTGTNTYGNSTFVNGGTLALAGNGSIADSANIIVASGAFFNVQAVNGGFSIASGQTLGGAGRVQGPVTAAAGSIIAPGGNVAIGALTTTNLSMANGSRLYIELGSFPNAPGSSNDLLLVDGDLNLAGTVNVNFSFLQGLPTPGVPYEIIAINGNLIGSTANLSAASLAGYSVAFDSTSRPGKILATFTAAGTPNDLVWAGNLNNNWILGITPNFTNAAGTAVVFSSGDNVLFDDTSTNQAVNISGSISPTTTTVNSSSNYTFSTAGSGSLTAGSLTKSGPGTLTVSTANGYDGTTLINGGMLTAGNGSALGTTNGLTVVTNGGTLNVGGQNLGAEIVVVSGAGYTNGGALLNYGAGQQNAFRFVVLAGDTTFGGNARWDIRANPTAFLSSGGQPFNITKVGDINNYVPLVNAVVDPALGDIDIQGGGFGFEVGTTGLGDPTKTINIRSNTYFLTYQNTFPVNKKITVQDGGTNRHDSLNVTNTGLITLVGGLGTFDTRAPHYVAGGIDGAGQLVKVGGNQLTLVNASSYSGGTFITAGSIVGTTDSIQGSITNNAHLIIDQNYDGTFSSGIVTGTGSFSKRGYGRVTMLNPMSISGTVTNGLGTIVLAADNVLGTGLLDWRSTVGANVNITNTPAFESSDATTRTLTNAVSISTDTRLGSATSGNLVFSGPVNNGGAIKVLTVSNANSTFSLGITNNGPIVKAGSGTLTLGGANNISALTVSNGTVALAAGAILHTNNIRIRPGAVLDVSAGAGATFTNIAGKSFIAGRSSGSGNDLVGNLRASGNVVIGDGLNGIGATAATLDISGNLHLASATVTVDLSSTTTTGGGVNDFVNVGGAITLEGTIVLNLNLLNGTLATGTYTLATGANPVATVGSPVLVLTNLGSFANRQTLGVAISGNSVVLNVGAGGLAAPLTWLGTNNNWDLGTANWTNTIAGSVDRFFNGDNVLFDNSSANTNVVLTTNVHPGTLTVNSDSNYTFSGSFGIAGASPITKAGSGTWTLGGANSAYAGPVTINGGTLKAGGTSALGTHSGITINNGGQFDYAGVVPVSRTFQFSLAGDGPDGRGALINTGAGVDVSAISNITLTADASIGSILPASSRMDIGVGYGLLDGGGFRLTKRGPGRLNIRSSVVNLPELVVAGGTLYTENIDYTLGARAIVETGAALGGTGGRYYTNRLDLANGSTWFTAVGAAASTWGGPVFAPTGNVSVGATTLSGGGGAQDVRLLGTLTGNANLFLAVHPLEISANQDATFSGNITVSNTTLRLATNGTQGTGVITNNNGTVEFNTFGDFNYARTIYGPAGTVTKNGTNKMTLTGTATDQISDGLVLNVLNGVVDLNGRSEGFRGITGTSYAALITNSGASVVSLILTNPSTTHAYNGIIGGPIRIVTLFSSAKNTVVQNLSGTNTFTGGILIDNGHLRVTNDYALGAIPGTFDAANITLRNGGVFQNFGAPVFVHPNRGIRVEGDGVFFVGYSPNDLMIVNGAISGAGRILKADSGRLVLRAANSFVGDIGFTNSGGPGTYRLDHPLALQFATFQGSTFGGGSAGTLDLNNQDAVIGMINAPVSPVANVANFNGRVTVGGNNQNGLFGSTLSGNGRLTKVGAGQLILTANNSHNGGTVASNGTLIAVGNLSGYGPVTVKPGATLVSGATVNGPVSVEANGTLLPGTTANASAALGTLIINNNLSLDSATVLYDLTSQNLVGSGFNDLITVSSNVILTGTTRIRFSFGSGAPLTGVPYTLVTYSGTLSGSAANLTSDSRYNATFDTSVSGQIRVTFGGAGGSNLVWTGNSANNTWDFNGLTNWFDGTGLSAFKDADSATFNDTGYAASPVLLSGILAPTAVNVGGSQNYTFAGLGRLNLGGVLTKTGSGTLTLANTNDLLGTLDIRAGRVAITTDEQLGPPPSTAGAQLQLNGGTLQVNDNVTLSTTRRLAVGPTNAAGTGTLEVTGTNTLTIPGVIGNNFWGFGTLVKDGAGALALSGANTHVGGTQIKRGTVFFRNDSALGTLGAITLGDTAQGSEPVALILDTLGSGGNRTLSRDIAVSANGSGPVILGSRGHPLVVGTSQAVFNSPIILSNRNLFLQSGAGDFTRFTGQISGTGDLIITNNSQTGDMRGNAGNRVVLDGLPKTFTGNIKIAAGTLTTLYTNFTVLQVGVNTSPNILPDTSNVEVEENAVFRLFNTEEAINNLSGSGRVRGVVNANFLTVGAAGGSSTFNGIIENDPFDNGSIGLVKAGNGTLTLNGTNTFTQQLMINAGTLAFGPNGSASNAPRFLLATGATLDVSNVTGGFTLMGNQTLAGGGSVVGNLTAASNAVINPGPLDVPGTLAVAGDLGLNRSNVLNFRLGASNTIGSGVNDLIDVTGNLSLTGTGYVTISAYGPVAAGTYTLIQCTGTKTGGAGNLVLVNNTGYPLTLGETANSITVTVGGTGARSLAWAASTNNAWQVGVFTNWLNGLSLESYTNADAVAFDSSTTVTQTTVAVAGTLLPSTVTLSGASNYTFSGAGKISGAASLVQASGTTGTNTMSLANDFNGTVTVQGGVLRAGNAAALGSTNGATYVSAGGSLDFNALNLGAETFVVSGDGYQGLGALFNSGAGQNNASRFVRLAGHTTFGGTGRWDIRGAATQNAALLTGGNAYDITKVGINQVSITEVQTVDSALGDVHVLGGILSVEGATAGLGDPSRYIRVGSTGTIQFWALTVPLNKPIQMTNGAQLTLGSGNTFLTAPVTLLGSNYFNVAGTTLTLSNAVDGAGTLWKYGAGTLLLAGNNSHSGGSVYGAGTVTIVGNEPNSGGLSNAATINLGNLNNSGTLGGVITNFGTINYQRADATTVTTPISGGGTLAHAPGSGPLTLSGSISNGTLRAASGNNSALTLDTGSYAFNGITVGNNPAGWLNLNPGATVFANQLYIGDASAQTGFVYQAGGDLYITNQFRLAHWPNNISTYLLGGGSLTLVSTSSIAPAGAGEQNGGFYIGIDGVGIFTQTNGTLTTPGIVLDNRGSSVVGNTTNTYILNGGTVNLGRWGFSANNVSQQIRLGGGTINSFESWTSVVTMTLTGTNGDVNFAPGSGFTNSVGGTLAGNGGLRKTGAGELVLAAGANTFAGNLDIAGGQVRAVAQASGGGTTLGLGNPSHTVTVGTGASLLMSINNVLAGGGANATNLPTLIANAGVIDSSRYNALGNVVLNGGTLVQTSIDGPGSYEGYQLLGSITVGGSSASLLSSGSGRGNHLLGNGTNTFNVADASGDSTLDLDVSTPLLNGSGDYAGAGSLRKVGAGTLRLNASHTYTGSTYIDAGAVQVTGSLSTGPVYVNSGTLAGPGVIGGAVAVAAGGTLAPGASIGTLTINNTLSLAGTTVAEVDRTSGVLTADLVAGVTTLTLGGTLTVTATGDPLQNGDVFNLFDATTFAGSFTSYNLPALPSGLAWDKTQLAVDGTLRVIEAPTVATAPANTTVELSSNAVFTVVAGGTGPFTYQWYFGTNAIPSANADTLTVTTVTLAQAGTYTVEISNVGATTNASAILTVIDTIAPTITTCVPAQTLAADTNCQVALPDFTSSLIATDACVTVTITQSPVPGTLVPLGATNVTFYVADTSSNTSSCSAIITVTDQTAPVVTNSFTNLTLVASATCQATLPDLTTATYITAGDACDTSLTITQSVASGTVLGLGTNEIVLGVVDDAGNVAYSTNTVVVADQTAPTITACATNPTAPAIFSDLGAVPDLTGTLTTADCGGSVTVTQAPLAGTLYAVGTYPIDLYAVDPFGNVSSCQVTLTVVPAPTPPSIVTEPIGATFECSSNAVITTLVGGTQPLAFQWYRGASPVAGQTNSTLNLPGITTAQAGNYYYIVTNFLGSATSAVATVTVVDTTPPALTCPANLTVSTFSTNGTNVSFSPTVLDGCNSYVLTCVPASGSFFPIGLTAVACGVVDTAGNSNGCQFSVFVQASHITNFTVNATIPDANPNGVASTRIVSTPIGELTDLNVRLNISGGMNGDLYAYLVHDSGISVLLNRVGRSVADPIGYADAGLNILLDDQAAADVHTYRFTLYGNETTPLPGALSGTWQPDGRSADPSGVVTTNDRSLFLTNFNGMNPNGSWTLFVADLSGLDTATLVDWGLEVYGTLGVSPTINTQPADLATNCSSSVTLSTVALGTGPISYQWYRNMVLLSNETAASLNIAYALPADSGTYSVLVSNAFGAVLSSNAVLSITEPLPVITANPVDRTNNVGTTATFTIAATSCGPETYQWLFAGSPISGATGTTLTLTNVQLANGGNYEAVVSNTAGSVTSTVAVLTVNREPIANPNGVATAEGTAVGAAAVKLLANDTDPDGDPITVVSVSPTSTNGGSVTLAGNVATYTPLAGFTGVDRYSYTINDNRGGSSTSYVEVFVANGALPSQNQMSIALAPNGILVRFAGIPGTSYRIQSSTSPTGPWNTRTNLVAPLHGIIQYLDTNPPQPTGYYRTASP